MIRRLEAWLTTPVERRWAPQAIVWFLASEGLAVLFSLPRLTRAFSGPYVLADDARAHVTWMERFMDPGLFPGDLIMDYFQSVSPPGFAGLYWLASRVGIEPFAFTKVIPLGLGLLTTGYAFGLALRLLPVPAAGFVTTTLLNHTLWLNNGLANGTPRAFIYPLTLAFLFHLVGRGRVPCLVVIALQALFYPQFVFILAGLLILRLGNWQRPGLGLSRDRRDLALCAAGLAVAALAMLPYALKSSEFGPIVTAAEARGIPAFWPPVGRTLFFMDDQWTFWLCGLRSGALPREFCRWPFTPFLISAGLLLPGLLRARSRVPLATRVTPAIVVLLQLAVASLVMFLLAHAFLFWLYLPSRYADHGLRIALILAAGIALVLLLAALFRWAGDGGRGRSWLALGLVLLLGAGVLWNVGFGQALSVTDDPVGTSAALYQFFARQPKDILVAALAEEADNLPPFSKRSILFGWEYATTYHTAYFRELRKRRLDLVEAQYTSDLAEVKAFIRGYGVDYWLLDLGAFTPEYVGRNRIVGQAPRRGTEILADLRAGRVPALSRVVDRCAVFETEELIVLEASCILDSAGESRP